MEIKIKVKVKPFPVPNYVVRDKPGTAIDAAIGADGIPIAEIDVDTLKAMANAWRDELFKKAGMKATPRKKRESKAKTEPKQGEFVGGPRDDENDGGTFPTEAPVGALPFDEKAQ
jgi:hypothetical protein